jgi:hypothetical protein
MKSLTLTRKEQGIKGGNFNNKNVGFAILEVKGKGNSRISISIDTFEGTGKDYKRKEKELIKISSPEFGTWSGTADDLKALITWARK